MAKKIARKTTSRKGKYAKKTKVSVAVKKYVNRMIHVDQENKVANFNPAVVKIGSVANSTNLYMRPLLPYPSYNTISQGIGAGQRIGNEIKIRKAVLRYVLRPNPYNVDSNPFPAPVQVDMFLGRTRLCPGDQPISGDFVNLFQNGNSSIGPVGSLNDLIANPNGDYFTIKKRWSHKIGYNDYYGSGSIATQQYFANNDFKMNVIKKLNITKMMPKTIKFNDGTNTVQGPGLFLWYQCVSASGAVNGSTVLPAHLSFWLDIQYEDA